MSVESGKAKIKQSAKDLTVRWREVEVVWRDERARTFERQFIAPLLGKLRAAEEAMDHVDSVLNHVRRDCS